MRFRMATGGYNALMQGADNAFGRILQLPLMEAQAREEAQNGVMKRDLMSSQIAQNMAQAAIQQKEAEALGGAPDLLNTVIASRSGTDVPTFNRWRESVRTGVQPTTSASGDADTDGAIGIPTQPAIPAELQQALAREYGRMAPAYINPKDFKMNDTAQAMGHYQDQDVLAQALEMARRGDDMGMSRLNTIRAKKEFTPFKAVGTTGTAMNEVTGQQNVANEAVNVLFNRGQQAEIGQRNASAASSFASADNSRASAAQHRAQTDQIVSGPKGQLVQTENGPVFADPRTGASVQVRNPDGTPALPAKKEKALPSSAAKGLLENQDTLRRAETALALAEGKTVDGVAGDAKATGAKGYLPNPLLNRVDPSGVDTRAALADLGSMLIHDRSGAAVSASEFPRLRPFVPSETDDSETVKKKLGMFVRNYRATVDEQVDFYRQLGYAVPSEALRKPNVKEAQKPAGGLPRISSDEEYDALPRGAEFVGPDGKRRRKE